jgi:hypothetical protein
MKPEPITIFEFIDARILQMNSELKSTSIDAHQRGWNSGSIFTLVMLKEGLIDGTIIPGCLA